MNILIEECQVVAMTDEPVFEGTLGIRGNRIELVSHVADGEAHVRRVEQFVEACGDDLRRVEGRGLAAMPGLVNIHGHAPMTLMRGYADDIPLFEWLNEWIWPFEANLTPEDVARGAGMAVEEMLRGGTTTCVDMYWMEASVGEAMGRGGIRAVVCPTFIDAKFDGFERDFHAVMDRLVTPKAFNGRLTAMIAPHSPYMCSEEHLRRAVERSEQYGLGINIHLAETLAEIETIYKRYGCTPTEYLQSVGLFERPVLAVHGVHLTEGDMDMLAHAGAAVAHNPQSNMKLASGTAPVARMLEKGITVGLGTDGAASNNDLDMWEEMRSASFLQKLATRNPTVLPAHRMLRMATIEGAKAIGMADRIGSLEEGKLADVILIDLRRPHLQPVHDLVANLAYCGKAADVVMTIVDGEVVFS